MDSVARAIGQLPPSPAQQQQQQQQQQEKAEEGSENEEIINVEDEPPPPAITTAADGTLRIRRQQLPPRATVARSGPLRRSGGSTAAGVGTTVEGIAVGRMFPLMGDPESTWANVEETVRAEIGGPYPLRRNNRQKLFRGKDEHEKSIPNRWGAVRIECAQAGVPTNRPLKEDGKKRRKTCSKKINCNWKVVCQWPQRSQGPYISQVHLTHDTTLDGEQGGKVHPPPMVFEDEISKREIQEQEDKIKELVDAGFGTTELHKYLQRTGKRLGDPGKQQVRHIRRKYQDAKAASSGEPPQRQPQQQQRQQLQPPRPPRQPQPHQPQHHHHQQQQQQQQQLHPPQSQQPQLQQPRSPQPPRPPQPQQPQPQQPLPPRPQHGSGTSAPAPRAPPLLAVSATPSGLASTIPGRSSPSASCRASPTGGGSSAGGPQTSGGHPNPNPTGGGPPSLEAAKLADCVAFGRELASMAAGINSRDALDRVIAHARVAVETAIKVELQCQGRRASADMSWVQVG